MNALRVVGNDITLVGKERDEMREVIQKGNKQIAGTKNGNGATIEIRRRKSKRGHAFCRGSFRLSTLAIKIFTR